MFEFQLSLSDKTAAPKPFRNRNSAPEIGWGNSGDFCKWRTCRNSVELVL